MDEIIDQYAKRLQEIYDNRTAGDYSFNGVLSEFLGAVTDSCAAVITVNDRHQRYTHNS